MGGIRRGERRAIGVAVWRALWGALCGAACLTACVAAAAPAGTQTSVEGAPVESLARMGDGKPNLNGIWQTINTANFNIEPHSPQAALAMRDGPLGPIPVKEVVALGAVGAVPGGLGVVVGGEIPYKPGARAKQVENQRNWLASDPEVKCYLPGVPRATYMPFPFQVFHSDSALFIAYEYAGAVRNILFTDPGEAPVEAWMGQSVGRWEGDTLVVEVTGMNDRTWFDRAGNHHSDALRVIERYTPLGPNHIQYEATIEDANTFTKPWQIRMPLYRRIEPGVELGQFKCVEFVEELMYGHLRKEPVQ